MWLAAVLHPLVVDDAAAVAYDGAPLTRDRCDGPLTALIVLMHPSVPAVLGIPRPNDDDGGGHPLGCRVGNSGDPASRSLTLDSNDRDRVRSRDFSSDSDDAPAELGHAASSTQLS